MLLLDGQIPLSSQVVLSLMRLSLQITLKSHENPEKKNSYWNITEFTSKVNNLVNVYN